MTNKDVKEVLDLVKSKSPDENMLEYLADKLKDLIKDLNEELLEAKGEMTMYTSSGCEEIYPIDDIKFLTKLCNYLMNYDEEDMEEIIENYNNHPNKEDLSECIEDITEGAIEWNMTVGYDYGFYNGSRWLFYDEPSSDSSDWC